MIRLLTIALIIITINTRENWYLNSISPQCGLSLKIHQLILGGCQMAERKLEIKSCLKKENVSTI